MESRNPPGTKALHLKCKNASNATTRRCAVFLEYQRSAFEAKLFTSLFPGAPRSQLGFAYGTASFDADGLPDAAEYVIGTSPTLPDSDGDGVNDGGEYPFTSLPVSDPCQGPNIQCPHILNRVFKDKLRMTRSFKGASRRKCLQHMTAAVAILLSSSSAFAGAGGPALTVNPTSPSSQQPFEVVYTLDGCGDTFPAYGANNRAVEVEGGVVRVTVAYAEQVCFKGQPYVPAYDWIVGPLPAGNHDVVLQGYSLNGNPDDTFVLAATTVVVSPGLAVAGPSVIPSSGFVVNAGLTLLVLAAAAMVRARQRRP